MHVGGALPSGRGRAWAESPAGLDYALRQIAGVSKGLTGRAAIENIVRRFERPADPAGEIGRALGAYGSFGAAGPAAMPPVAPPGHGGIPGPPPGIPIRPGNLEIRSFAGQADSPVDAARIALDQIAPFIAAKPTPLPPSKRSFIDAHNQATAQDNAPKGALFAVPARGKIIGTPYSGTHTLGNWESDNAIDVATPVGTPIYAPFNGVIGTQFGSLGKGGRFAGLRVHVQGAQNEWYGGHLSRLVVKPGQHVRAGQLIGYSGSANGVAHLHEALRTGDPRRLDR